MVKSRGSYPLLTETSFIALTIFEVARRTTPIATSRVFILRFAANLPYASSASLGSSFISPPRK